jgi:nucleoid DNA-binding protein
MTKAELVARIAEEAGITKADAEKAMTSIIASVPAK